MAAYEPEAPRGSGAGRAIGAFLRVAVVLTIVLAGLYFIFTGGGRPDRHALTDLNANRPLIGASLGDWPTDSNPVIGDFEDKVEMKLDVVDVFLDWSTPYDNVSHTLSHIAGRGAIPQLSWEPHGLTTTEIVEGTKRVGQRDGTNPTVDEYLTDFATGLCSHYRTTHQPILLRTMHEFNGGWFSWGIGYVDGQGGHPNTDESYRAAWIKIHDAIDGRCDGAVRFVWALNHFNVGPGTSFMGPYPGPEYVDYVGMDGYNWGEHEQWGWQSFDQIFRGVYCAASQGTTQPILIAEVGSTEAGGDKAAWIQNAFDRITSGAYPRVQGLVWFNTGKYERESKAVIEWNADSSEASLEAFREGAQRFKSLSEVPQHGDRADCPR